MFGIAIIPAFGNITPFGMEVLGIFVGCLYAYAVGIVIWPTILGFIMLATYQNISIQTLFQSAFGNQTLWLIVWSLIFCYAIGKCGLLNILSKWIISLKITRKGPYWMILMFWIAGWLVSIITLSSFPVLILLWSIFYGVMDQVGIDRYSKYSNTILIGMAVPIYLGSCTLPFNPWAQIMGSLFSSMGIEVSVSFGKYFIFAVFIAILYFALAIAITKFIIRPEINFELQELSLDKTELKLNLPQKIGLWSLIGMIIFLLAPSFMPDSLIITQWMINMGITGCFVIVALVLTFIPISKGKKEKVFTIEEGFKFGVDWRQFFLLSLCFYVAGLLSDESTGIMTTINGGLVSLLSGKSVMLTIILLTLLGAILTNLLNNMVCATLMAPIAIMVASTNNINITVFVLIFSIILIQGCIFPSGSAMGAILHGNINYIKSKHVYVYATVYTMLLAVIVGVIAVIFKDFVV